MWGTVTIGQFLRTDSGTRNGLRIFHEISTTWPAKALRPQSQGPLWAPGGARRAPCGFCNVFSHRFGRPCGRNLVEFPESALDSGIRFGKFLDYTSMSTMGRSGLTLFFQASSANAQKLKKCRIRISPKLTNINKQLRKMPGNCRKSYLFA